MVKFQLTIFLALATSLQLTVAFENDPPQELFDQLRTVMKSPDALNPMDNFLLDILPVMVGQAPNNINGTMSEFKEYVMTDDSNDDAAGLTGVSTDLL